MVSTNTLTTSHARHQVKSCQIKERMKCRWLSHCVVQRRIMHVFCKAVWPPAGDRPLCDKQNLVSMPCCRAFLMDGQTVHDSSLGKTCSTLSKSLCHGHDWNPVRPLQGPSCVSPHPSEEWWHLSRHVLCQVIGIVMLVSVARRSLRDMALLTLAKHVSVASTNSSQAVRRPSEAATASLSPAEVTCSCISSEEGPMSVSP